MDTPSPDFRPYSETSASPHTHFKLPVRIETPAGSEDTVATVDSGATHDFIDSDFTAMHSLPQYPLSTPRHLLMADGSESRGGLVSHESALRLAIGPHSEDLRPNVTKLGSHNIILGMPWLRHHDPHIHWDRRLVTFNSSRCLSEGHVSEPVTIPAIPVSSPISSCRIPHIPIPTPLTPTPPKPVPVPIIPVPVPASRLSRFSSAMPVKSTGLPSPEACASQAPPSPELCPRTSTRSQSQSSTPSRLKSRTPILAPQVSLINSAALNLALKQPSSQMYKLYMAEITNSDSDSDSDPASKIPAEYQDYADVFSKTEAHKLPEHRPYDLSIPLQEGPTPPFGPVYNLSPLELDVLRKYIDENLRKGFIRHSQSPAGAPILFVKKADGSLRLCVDYRGINKITIKNRYPLPLIPELLDKVGQATRFTAMDMRDGYHLLRMAPGEEWKTAFRTGYGLFEYNVVPFGLCNAPAAFQHLMNDVLREYLDDFVVIYLDDVLIYSKNASEHRRHVRMVLEKLRQAGLYAKPEKCQFSVQEVAFLGY